MENLLSAKVGFQLKRLIIIVLCFTLYACASSAVQRDTATNFDLGARNAERLVTNAANTDISATYQNSSQAVKGAILGGILGATVGGVATTAGALPVAAVGLILGASYGSYIDTHTSSHDRLENRGLNIIVLGDQVLIVIPSALLFDCMTASLKTQAIGTLNMIANYINKYTTMLVKVSGYTTRTGAPEVDFALSKQQADAVARYLTAAGVNTRLIYAEGYGGTTLVAPVGLDWYASDNYRIEITFEKLYV